jgi:GT2 family glycosyltransferase/glycosyltransferase involved in cell wall biosynthesis
MKIYGVMMVRNEADILRLNLLHHHAVGIDRFLIVDNGSSDRTPEILEEFHTAGFVDWRREDGKYRQAEITTDLAREAVRAGADWVLPIDADEFWCSVGDTIPAILERSDAGALRAQVLNFVQRRDQHRSSPEALLQMTMRAPLPVGPLDQVRSMVESGRFAYVEMLYQPKWISRAAPELTIAMGNHHISGVSGNLEETEEIVCLHAVLRSREALEAKVEQGARVAALGLAPTQGWHVQRWRRLAADGRLDAEWSANSYDRGALDVYGTPHQLIFDPRLRDLVRPWVEDSRPLPEILGEASVAASRIDDLQALTRSIHHQLTAFQSLENDLRQESASDRQVRDLRIGELQRELFHKVEERDRTIRALQTELHAKVAERDAMIRSLQGEKHELLARAAEAKTRAEAARVEASRAEVVGTETRQERDAGIERPPREAAGTESEILALRQQLHDAREQLDTVFRSRLWRIGTFYWRLLDRLKGQPSARTPLTPLLPRDVESRAGEVPVEQPPIVAPLLRTDTYDVVCFPIIDWDFRFQRPQQLMTQFADAGHRVFYLAQRFRRSGQPFELRALREGIWEVSLRGPQRNVYKDRLTAQEAEELFASLDAMRRELSLAATASILQLPFWRPVAELARDRLAWPIVYDCMDHHAGFSTATADTAHDERALLQGADLVLVSSLVLEREARAHNQNVALVRNACDYDHFAAITSRPSGARTVVGYYGAIADWFDSDLVADLAELRPDWDFVLVGSTFTADLRRLSKLKNVRLPGEQPYAEIPRWLESFDVAIIPFRRVPLTEATNPVKAYEMLAAGKPVISVPIPEVVVLGDVVRTASTAAEFANEIEDAIANDSEQQRTVRKRFAAEHTWRARFETLQPLVRDAFPKASVIIVTYNNVELNRLCLESLYATMDWPNAEVFVVDNASKDETPQFLDCIRDTYPALTIILNDENRGFAAANNQALRLASGEILILLNNDTVTPRGWIAGLARHLRADPSIGILGPSTNAIGNEAMIPAGYDDIAEMPRWVGQWVREHDGETFDIAMLAMYCLAMRRDVFERVGLLDEQFGVGMFEDDDYAQRIRQEGLRVVCTRDVFIHHWMKAAFGKIPNADYQKLFEKNRALYEAKWGGWVAHKGA